jgi:hypothetical protein
MILSNWSISSKLFNLCGCSHHSIPMILLTSEGCVVVSPLFILAMDIFSLSLSLSIGLSMLLIFFKELNHLFVSSMAVYCFPLFILTNLWFYVYLAMNIVCSSIPSFLRWKLMVDLRLFPFFNRNI